MLTQSHVIFRVDTLACVDVGHAGLPQRQTVPAGVEYTLQMARPGTFEVLVQTTATLAANLNYFLIATGDGQTQPFKLQIVADHTASTAPDSINARDIPATASTSVDLKFAAPRGQRNLVDIAPLTLANGDAVDLFFIGDGVHWPYRVVSPQRTLTIEGAVDYATSGLWAIASRPLEGFSFNPEQQTDRLLGVWSGHADGAGGQRWYALDSCRPLRDRRLATRAPGSIIGMPCCAPTPPKPAPRVDVIWSTPAASRSISKRVGVPLPISR